MPNETRKKRRILPWAVVTAAVVAGSAAAFVLSVPLDLTRFNDRIERAIEAEVNGDVELGRIVLKVLPSPELTLTQFRASYKGAELFSSDRLFARIRLLPLLSGSLSVEAVEADNPSIVLVRGRDGSLNLNEFLKKEKPDEKDEPDKPEKKKKKRPAIESVKVTGGTFSFIDRFPMQTASFNISAINASSARTNDGTSFNASGLLAPATPLAVNGVFRDSLVEGAATIKGLDLVRLNPYIKTEGARITAIVDAELIYKVNDVFFTAGDVRYRTLNASYPTTWDRPLISPSGSGKMSLKIGKDLFDLTVSEILLNMGTFTTSGSVHVEGPKKKKSLDLHARTTPVDLSRFISLLPTKKMSPEAASRIRAIEPIGGAVAVDLTLAGPVKELRGTGILKNPRIAAELTLDGLSFKYKDLRTPFNNVSGAVSYKDRVFRVSDLRGRYSRQILDDLDGTIKELSGAGSYDVAVKGSFDVKDTLELARSRTGGKTKESLSLLDADGIAEVNATISGALKGKTTVKYAGSANLSNGSAFYKGVPVGLEVIDASLDFNNERITVKEARVRTDSSALSLDGFVDGYRGKDPYIKVRSEGSLSAETLSKALSKGPEELRMTGMVPFALSAEGTKNELAAKASVDVTGSGLFIKRYVDKAPGFPLIVEAEGGLKGKTVFLDKASFSFGSSVVSGSGRLLLGAPVYSASLVSEQLLLSDLDAISPFLDSGYETSGVLSFRLKSSKESKESAPSYEGDVRVRDGSFETGFLRSPVENITASARLAGNTARLAIERLETGSTVLEGSVDVLDLEKRTFVFDLNFPTLNSDDLMPRKREEPAEEKDKKEEEQKKEPGEKERRPMSGSGVIRAAQGELWKHQFKSFSANVLVDPNGVDIKPASIEIDGGKLTGSVFVFLDKDDPRVFVADVRGEGLKVEQVTRASSPRKFLNGTARASFKLTGMRGEGPLVKRMNGSGSVTIEDGRLWKFGFITDIFSLVNVISLDELFKTGLPYKDIEGTFNMDRGIISTSDLEFDSNSLRMSAVGAVHLPENTIDLTLALHPFVTIDKIISNIPLAGWILTGKDESTVSLFFEVEGPLKSPEVTPQPVKTIDKTIIEIFERLLRAPFRLFD